jgi:hypothetical protein
MGDIAIIGQAPAFAVGATEEGYFAVILGDTRGSDVFVEPARQVMAHRNLAILAAFFPEAEHVVIAQVPVVGQAEFSHGADAGASIGQDAEDGAIAQADDMPVLIDLKSLRACSMPSSAVLPSMTLYLMPRTEAKGLRATAWRCTRASKKCRSAASAWFLVGAEPAS